MRTAKFVGNVIFVVLFILLVAGSFFTTRSILHKREEYKDRVKAGSGTKDIKIPLLTEILSFVFITLSALMVLNCVYLLLDRLSLEFPSILSYKDTLLMLISIMGPVLIAFFQYRMQKSQEEFQQELRDNEKNQNKDLRRLEIARHKSELKASMIWSLYPVSNCEGKAICYNLPAARNYYYPPNTDTLYEILITNTEGTPCFFQQDFTNCNDLVVKVAPVEEMLVEKKWKEKPSQMAFAERLKVVPENCLEISCSRIKLMLSREWLSENREEIDKFFVSAMTYPSQSPQREKLCVVIQVKAEEPFMMIEEDKFEISYQIQFSLFPDSGFDSKGSFSLKISEVSIRPCK